MKRFAAGIAVAAGTLLSFANAQTDLIISEYVEGATGFNKYVEIYNGTGSPVDLDNYVLQLYSNGSATVSASINLGSGSAGPTMLANCGVFVLGNSSGTIYEENLAANAVCNFNGDDAVALFKISTGTFADVFGNIGCDPGTNWTAGGNQTSDRSLRRNCGVSGVVTDPSVSCPFPTLATEWTTSAGGDDASNLGVVGCSCGTPAPCSDGLFFSQYTEGSSFNKCVEIANYTGAAVNLAGYKILAFHNGAPGPVPTNTINLTGTVADGDVFVVCNPSANAALLAITDQTSSGLQPNGDDALVLISPSGDTLDIFGDIGCDPGTQWSAGGNNTADNTLFRNSAVTNGVTANPAGACGTGSFATLGTEWFSGPLDVATGFGTHNISCPGGGVPTPELGPDQVLCAGESAILDAGDGSSYLWSTGATTPSITVSASGVYGVTVTNSSGSASDVVTIIVKDDVNVTISGDNQTCSGESTTLTANLTSNDLFISEYVEGSGNNKCLEISNLTGSAITLTGNYSLFISFNGGSGTASIPLTGTIAAGDVHVLCDDEAVAAFLASADQTTTTSLWNGGDAIVLRKGSLDIDIFGRVGSDPGAQWGNPLGVENNTADRTLRRNCDVYSGVNANPSGTSASGFTTLQSEWTEFAIDEASGLGSHSGCASLLWSTGATTSSITVSPSSSAAFSVTAAHDNGCTNAASSNVTLSNPLVVATGDATICEGNTTTICADVNSRELFFSEYVEGSSLNKCIEIFNNTGVSVDLAAGGYTVEVTFNGGTTTISLPLTGVVADGDAYVLCDDGAAAAFLANADQTTTFSLWNGNDALVLKKGSSTLDIFGVINSDPGTAWICGGSSTMDATLRRVSSVSEGVTVNPTGTGPGAFGTLCSEWVAFANNDASGLGSHSFTAGGSFSWSNGATTACTDVTPSTTTTYTITYTENGCSSSDEVTVTVNSRPVVDAGSCRTVYSGYGSTCVTLTASVSSGTAPYNYLWSNGATTASISVCPGTTTTYSVTVTDNNGCTGSDDVTVNVVDISCKGDKVTICHVPPGNPSAANTLCIAASAVPAHLAHSSDYLGACGAADPCSGSAKTSPAASAEAAEESMTAFPNPFTSNTSVQFALNSDDAASVKVFSMTGVLVATLFEGPVSAGQNINAEFSAETLSAGIYFAKLTTASGKEMNVKLVLTK